FHEHLDRTLQPAQLMEQRVRETVMGAKPLHDQRHLRLPEAAFLNKFIIPELATAARRYANLTVEQVRNALLNEYHRSMKDISRASPLSTVRHPFTKVLVHWRRALLAHRASEPNRFHD